MGIRISNLEFLSKYLPVGTTAYRELKGAVVLPHEGLLIQQRLAELEERDRQIAQERSDITAQSGDSWHDGALRESDLEVNAVRGERAKLTERMAATVVDYPEATEDRITLGSRAELQVVGARKSVLDIVGFSIIHNEDGSNARKASLEAPIVEAILGKKVGEIALLTSTGRPREIEILNLDQEAQRKEHEDNDRESVN